MNSYRVYRYKGKTMKGSILVIDDEVGTCDLLGEFFSYRGFSVITAYSGYDGYSVFRKLHPKMVFIDLRMPGIDGLEVIRKIRGEDKKVKILVITGVKDNDVSEEALRLGADEYVIKPFDLQYLIRNVLLFSLDSEEEEVTVDN